MLRHPARVDQYNARGGGGGGGAAQAGYRTTAINEQGRPRPRDRLMRLQAIHREVHNERSTDACGERKRGAGASPRDEVERGVDVLPCVRAERKAVHAVRIVLVRRVRG